MTQQDRDMIFDKATELSEKLNNHCSLLLEMLDNMDDLRPLVRRSIALEDEADHIFHEFTYELNKIDMDEELRIRVFHMVRHVENCIDLLDGLAQSFIRYNVTVVTDGLSASINSIASAAKKEINLVNELRNSSDDNKIISATRDFDVFKGDYQKLYDIPIRNMFMNNTDAIDVMRWKTIYDEIMDIFSAFEVMADDCYKFVVFTRPQLVSGESN